MPGDHWEEQLCGRLSAEIMSHSVRTATTAADLAEVHGLDADRAYAAGLLHDVAKPLLVEKLSELLAQAAAILPSELLSDLAEFTAATHLPEPTIHAWASAVICVQEFKIQDPSTLSAIAKHTAGATRMSPLDMVLYVSDSIEPSRFFPGIEKLREIAGSDLSAAFFQAVRLQLAHLLKRRTIIHPVIYKIVEQGIQRGYISPKDPTIEEATY